MPGSPVPTEPLIDVSIDPYSPIDRQNLQKALAQIAAHDPPLVAKTDQETGQTIISGWDEAVLASTLDMLGSSFSIGAKVGRMQVAYRESLGHEAEVTFTHKRHLGPMSQYAQVKILFGPGQSGSGFQFQNKAARSIPQEYVLGIERGLAKAKDIGWIAGFPVIDVKATLIGGKYHDVDSSVMAFEIAAQGAFRELRATSAPILLEPHMTVDIHVPGEHVGAVIDDLARRGSQIRGTQLTDSGVTVTALAPLARMLGYSAVLRSLSQASAQCTMQFHSYRVRPRPEPPDSFFPPALGMRA